MKPTLIILSDLWGAKRSSWLDNFQKTLGDDYKIKFYDACVLGEIDSSDDQEKNIHRQFIDFGIQKAVKKLLTLEKEPQMYLGCSVGGVILWKAGLQGLPIKKLLTISATRLRKEIEKPNCSVELYFGQEDSYQPDGNWFKNMKIKGHFIPRGGHDIYKDQLVVKQILHLLRLQ